jgi:hypothetical protein
VVADVVVIVVVEVDGDGDGDVAVGDDRGSSDHGASNDHGHVARRRRCQSQR